MSGNTFGKLFTITSFGESHGPAMGVVIDGMPAQIEINTDSLRNELLRRSPGLIAGTSERKEEDRPEILSGIYEGKTLGSPIAVIVKNLGQKSSDYDQLKNEVRPGHADQTYMLKYGIRDHRGGGRSSARETLSRVIGGYFAGLVIPQVKVLAYIERLGPFAAANNLSPENLILGKYGFPSLDHDQDIENFLVDLRKQGESVGGNIRIIIENCPPGLGAPVFDKLKADFAKAFLSVPACVSFSFGLGDRMQALRGSEVSLDQNNFGGIEGGISNGKMISMNLVFKPTTTLGKRALEGRHDPCVLPRAIPIVEAMAKIVLADHYLRQKAYGRL